GPLMHKPLIAILLPSLLIVCGVSAVAQPASKSDTSANDIFLGCKAFVAGQALTLQLNAGGNYCSGIVDALAGVTKYLQPPEWQSCAPPNSDARQLARVVINYIEARPQRMHEDFRRLTMEAFHNAWPCPLN